MTLITFLGAGRYSDVFSVSDGHHKVVMKLSYYRDSTWCDFVKKMRVGDQEGARQVKNRDSIMVSAAFANASNDLMARSVSPHFVYTYCHADCRNMAPRLKALIQERVKSSSKIQLKFSNACFMEVFSGDMTKWLRGKSHDLTDATIRAALFGVLYTLAVLQRTYPGFRHNDLSSNNILVKKLKSPNRFRASYAIDGQKYYVDTPVLAAIHDMDFLHVPGHAKLSNERVVNGKYRVTATPNPTYDTHFLLKSIMKSLYFKRGKFPETDAFLASLPLEKEDRLDTQPIAGLEPDKLLRHRYFDVLKQPIAGGGSVDAYSATN